MKFRILMASALFAALGLSASPAAAQRLFAVNSEASVDFLATVDITNGDLAVIGPTLPDVDGLAFSPDGRLFAAQNSGHSLITLDKDTGAFETLIGAYGDGVDLISGLAFHPTSGVLYGIDFWADELVTLNTSTGQVASVGPMNTGVVGMAGLSWSADGTTLYAIKFTNGCLYQLDAGTGNATVVGCGSTFEPQGLATDPSTGQLYTVEYQGGLLDMELAAVDSSSGIRTVIGTMVGGKDFSGISFEPASLGTKFCVANANSTGSPADIRATGSASSSAGSLHLAASPVPNQNGIFFHGTNSSQIPFGNGFLCATGGIARGVLVSGSSNFATYVYDNSDNKHSLANQVGSNRKFQYWYRDPMGGGAQFNTSNAIAIDVLP